MLNEKIYNRILIRKDIIDYLIKYCKYPESFTNIIKYIIKNDKSLIVKCWHYRGVHDKNGYAKYMGYAVHRYIWEFSRRNSAKGKIIRHNCDNPGRINPFHLKSGTAQDNSNDMIKRNRSLKGDKHPDAKLTTEDVKDIYNSFLNYNYTISYLASFYQVSEHTIYQILRNKTWKNVINQTEQEKKKIENLTRKNQLRNKLNKDDVILIRKLYNSGNHTKSSIAKSYNLGVTTISNIVTYKSWKQVP